jgi:hypothetical protein
MRCYSWISFAPISFGLAIALYEPGAHAQMYPQDIHAHSRIRGPASPTQHASGGMYANDSGENLIQRREEEERERREVWERQRRMMENFTNIPEQLRESYFRRQSGNVTR